ncbi:MAG: ATP-binding protein [Bacteroidia bacterium]|nr:ATP-binding protein [Bacteroidia bacterium]
MSKINILGIVKNIKSKSNVYSPIVEAVVNSIDAIGNNPNGKIDIIVYRENVLEFDNAKPYIINIEVNDNGVGFTQENTDSFDTYLSEIKLETGGKGFGRFIYLKYFNDVIIKSQYKEGNNYKFRNFRFGKHDEIIVDKEEGNATENYTGTKLILKNIIDKEQLDKGLDVIARKLVEKLLVFFVNTTLNVPQITLRESDKSASIILNDFINDNNSISKVGEKLIFVKSTIDNLEFPFTVKVYKIYFSPLSSKVVLAAHNREVTETTLQTYIPEFQDEFYDITNDVKKNYIIKSYVLGEYLNNNVSLERESFDFAKDVGDRLYPLGLAEIEKEVANVVRSFFEEDVTSRFEKKTEKVKNYVIKQAPWHRIYLNNFDFTNLPTNLSDEKIEMEFQKLKFKKEQETHMEIKEIIANEKDTTDEKFKQIISTVSQNGKNDLAHYVCNRKLIIDTFDELRKRREIDNKAHLESELHNLIFPMGRTTENLDYEDHNLWLLDERLVFSQYVASDKIISKSETIEPDLIVFNEEICIYRHGENITTSPLTIFEFKRPKRTNYPDNENPIMQACRYAEKIRLGMYEMPDGLEPIKVSNETPVFIYVVSDIADKIHEFAKGFSLTISPDGEGYFGFSSGFNAYIEVISYRKLIDDAKMRNKIFFKKLGIE